MLVRGEGCCVWDDEGNEYLDFLAGIAVNSLGHAHPAFVEAVADQAATLVHVSNYFATPPQLELAERLKRITGAGDAGRVYFGNSGAEANEAAFKLARLNTVRTARKTRILALKNGFHGRTMGALALTGKPALQRGVPADAPGRRAHRHHDRGARGGDRRLRRRPDRRTDQGRGRRGRPAGGLPRWRHARLTAEHGVLLILDEIQTGRRPDRQLVRVPAATASTPDAVTIAKGIAGGFPIGALVTFGWASDLFSAGQHGSTFGGNPLATASPTRCSTRSSAPTSSPNAVRQG